MNKVKPESVIAGYVERVKEAPEKELKAQFQKEYAEQIDELYYYFILGKAVDLYAKEHPDYANMPVKKLGLSPAITKALEFGTNGKVGGILLYTKEELANLYPLDTHRRIGAAGAEKVWQKLQEIGAV